MNKNCQIRTRFAPSPTGELHIGGARTALFNYLFAKKNRGRFFLRIENTDIDRLVLGADKNIIKALLWLRIEFDGQPIYQSNNLNIYKKLAEELVKEGKAYWCHCSEERLKNLRQRQIKQKLAPKYDGLCREKNLGPKEGAVIRLKMPLTGETIINDLIHGQIIFKNELLDDQVLLKSDGYPTYHLASVVDDHQAQITHVMRSDEWLSSTPKHLVLYQAFEWSPPQFAHLPMILGPDKTKLSKRHGATSILQYRQQGYLPEALVNFMAFLGWNPGDEREIFTLEELIKEFSLERIQKSGAIFNIEKLNWLNGYYIRQMSLDKLTEMCVPYLESRGVIEKIKNQKVPLIHTAKIKNKFQISETKEVIDFNWLKKIVGLEQERVKKLSEIGELTEFFFKEKLEYKPELLRWKKMTNQEIKTSLDKLCDIIEKIKEKDFNQEKLAEFLLSKAKEMDDRGELLWPLRVALSGQAASPGPFEIMEVLGKEKTLKRIKQAREKI